MVERLSNKCPCDKCGKDRKCELAQEACENYLKWEDGCIKKLAEYETAEDEGRLVVLPCSVGDTVWVTTHPLMYLMILTFIQKHKMKYTSRIFLVLLFTKIAINTEYMQKKPDSLSRRILWKVTLEKQSFSPEKKPRKH